MGPAASPEQCEVYRSLPALVLWWVWVAVAVAILAVHGRQHSAAVGAAVVVLVTGVMYALAFRPRVVADERGITVLNPLREHRVPWGAVTSRGQGQPPAEAQGRARSSAT